MCVFFTDKLNTSWDEKQNFLRSNFLLIVPLQMLSWKSLYIAGVNCSRRVTASSEVSSTAHWWMVQQGTFYPLAFLKHIKMPIRSCAMLLQALSLATRHKLYLGNRPSSPGSDFIFISHRCNPTFVILLVTYMRVGKGHADHANIGIVE